MQYLRPVLALFFLTYVFVDFLRHFAGGSLPLLLMVDLVVASAFLLWLLCGLGGRGPDPDGSRKTRPVGWARGRNEKRPPLPLPFLGSVLIFSLYLLGRALTSPAGDAVLTLAGLRTYFVPFLMLFPGMYLARHWNRRIDRRATAFLLTLLILAVGFACVQTIAGTGTAKMEGKWGDPLSPAGHSRHSYGFGSAKLTSSFFASSKRFGRFALITFLVLWAMRGPVLGLPSRASRALACAMAFVGIILSGSREAFVLFFCCMGVFLLCARRMPKWAPQALAACSLSAAGLFVLLGVTDVLPGLKVSEYKSEHSRAEFLFSRPRDYFERVIIALPILRVRKDAPTPVFGGGLGQYGQEVRLVDRDLEETRRLVRLTFRDSVAGPAARFGDAGLTRILIELGWVGLFAFAQLAGVFSFYLARAFLLARKARDALSVSACLVVVVVGILFLKSHAVLSDVGLMSMFWLALGFLLARYRRWKRVPVLAVRGSRSRNARVAHAWLGPEATRWPNRAAAGI